MEHYKVFIVLAILLIAFITSCSYNVKDESLDATAKEVIETPVEEMSEKTQEQILAENTEKQKAANQKNGPPTITITEPDDGEVIKSDTFIIWWKAEDPNNDQMLISLEYNKDGKWVLFGDNLKNDREFLWNTKGLSNGDYILRATVTDGSISASDTTIFSVNK